MIAVILIVIGALLILFSVAGTILLLIEPLRRNFQIVINRKDDYTHYLNPAARRMLKKAKKDYIAGLFGLFFCGAVVLLTGLYMQFGTRGAEMFFSSRLESFMESDEAVQGGQAEGINNAGNYVASDGTEYVYYFVVRGNEIYYRNEPIENTEAISGFLEKNINGENTVYLVDGYASSATFHGIMDLLDEAGYKYKIKDEDE